ncbi:MAG: CRISPR-associated endonuclease Cas1, partial [Leptolyngbya sp. SIO4C1]|nr:CRISPR-associated endonuclease Cas1 [Leptolyngbya sp. SIO4C1]
MHDWLEDIYLTLHPEKTRVIAPSEGFVFLGHQFQNGDVQAPVRKPPRAAKAKQPRPGYGPPKACSLIKLPKTASQPSTDDYWRDDMTTLYVTEHGAYLRVKHQQFQVFHERELRCSIPANSITHIVLFGVCNVSHGAVRLALQRRIPLLYLSDKGR